MDNVVDLAQKRIENSPHTSGEIICMECQHVWVGVAPVGTYNMECPKCHLMKGTHKYICMPEDHMVFTCNCGNNLFFITTKGNALCPKCAHLIRITDD